MTINEITKLLLTLLFLISFSIPAQALTFEEAVANLEILKRDSLAQLAAHEKGVTRTRTGTYLCYRITPGFPYDSQWNDPWYRTVLADDPYCQTGDNEVFDTGIDYQTVSEVDLEATEYVDMDYVVCYHQSNAYRKLSAKRAIQCTPEVLCSGRNTQGAQTCRENNQIYPIGLVLTLKPFKVESSCYGPGSPKGINYYSFSTIREFETLADCQGSLPRR